MDTQIEDRAPTPAPAERGEKVAELKQRLLDHLRLTVGKNSVTTTELDWFHVVAQAVRNELVESWLNTFNAAYDEDAKRVYYFSVEFLIGRSLINNLIYTGNDETVRAALREVSLEMEREHGIHLDLDLERIAEQEAEAALGNGGLGRLAACILDSLATQGIPGYGYGIRYDFGMFHQMIDNGEQVEMPDHWLRYGTPWEFARAEFSYPVKLFGHTVQFRDELGREHLHWVDTEEVLAVAHDMPVPGYGNKTVTHLRLWKAKSPRDFDLTGFNRGNYIEAVRHRAESESLSRVLYPDDSTSAGKALRLKQEYFFVSASLQDIVRRFLSTHRDLRQLPDKVAIQLNDTHPAIAIPELMRLLMDVHHLDWDTSWTITTRTFSYTNHTLLPEALEKWPVHLFEWMLPRHLRIIEQINHRFLETVRHRHPGDDDIVRRISIFEEDGERRVRMGNLAFVGSHKVNGVAAIHTELMKEGIFADLHRFFPDRIVNKTNGITPRRWLRQANPPLAGLITSRIGDSWVTNLSELRRLEPLVDDAGFQDTFRETKATAKQRLADLIERRVGLTVDLNSMFDIHVKRIHEYKRQLLNVLHVVTRYNRIRSNPGAHAVPRTVIFAGKAAPGYYVAKMIIELINSVADVVNNDPVIDGRLKVVFIPNYNVSSAEVIIPAADLSEQISTAGTEASGTGNMKLSLNGALTIGTRDGANIEIAEEVGEENIFFFGLLADEANALRHGHGYDPRQYYHQNPELKHTLDMIAGGFFSPNDKDRFKPLIDNLLNVDHYLLLADYASYIDSQTRVDHLFATPDEWTRKTILNVARMGKFSIDRTVMDYAQEIWNVKPLDYVAKDRREEAAHLALTD